MPMPRPGNLAGAIPFMITPADTAQSLNRRCFSSILTSAMIVISLIVRVSSQRRESNCWTEETQLVWSSDVVVRHVLSTPRHSERKRLILLEYSVHCMPFMMRRGSRQTGFSMRQTWLPSHCSLNELPENWSSTMRFPSLSILNHGVYRPIIFATQVKCRMMRSLLRGRPIPTSRVQSSEKVWS